MGVVEENIERRTTVGICSLLGGMEENRGFCTFDICRLPWGEVPRVDGGGAHGISGELEHSGLAEERRAAGGVNQKSLWGRYAVEKPPPKRVGPVTV